DRGRRAKARVEILGQPPNEETGSLVRRIEQPRDHRARRRLAVRSGDDEGRGIARPYDEIDEGVRHRRDLQSAVDCGPRLDVVAPTHVADDHQLRSQDRRRPAFSYVRRIEASKTTYSPASQLRADGGIERDVGTGHVVPHRPKEARERPHSGPRYAYAMDAH